MCTRNKKSAQSTYYTSVVIKGSDKMTYTHAHTLAHTEQTFTHIDIQQRHAQRVALVAEYFELV